MNAQGQVTPDEIFEDLKKIRRAKWSRRDGFDEVELLQHEMVAHHARMPKKAPQLVDSLRGLLINARRRLAKQEKSQSVPMSRSVAFAAGSLLRLDRGLESKDLREIRKDVAKVWEGPRGRPVQVDAFRLHHEGPHVLRPFAEEFHAFLFELATERKEGATFSSAKERQMVRRLVRMEEKTCRTRIKEIERDGDLKIRNQAEMMDILRMVNGLAKQSLRAVDQTEIGAWTANPLLETYLEEQLQQVRKKSLALERIYVVEQKTLRDEDDRKRLREFIELHEAASATVLLCPTRVAGAVGSNFFQKDRGLLLADSEKEPLAVTGKMSEGQVGRTAHVYTREQPALQEIRELYEELRERAKARGHDRKLRAGLGLKP